MRGGGGGEFFFFFFFFSDRSCIKRGTVWVNLLIYSFERVEKETGKGKE